MSSTYARSQRPLRFASGLLAKPVHVCAFFHSTDEESQVLSLFLRDAFARGEKAVDLVHPDQREQHRLALLAAGVALSDTEKLFELRSWAKAEGGRLDQHAMLALIRQLLDESHAQGFPLASLVAHMEWALDAHLDDAALLEYEDLLDQLQATYADPIICSYDLSKWRGRVVVDLMRTHPVVIVGGVLHENPFFAAPAALLRERRARAGAPARPNTLEQSSLAFDLEALPASGRELSGCLVHLLSLPALFNGENAQAILDIVLDALLGMLHLELAYAEVAGVRTHPPLSSARAAENAGIRVEDLPAWLAPCMSADTLTQPLALAHPNGDDTLHALCLPIGLDGESALLVASARADFPSSSEKLVLLLAANQACLGIAQARVIAERDSAQREVRALYDSERKAHAEAQQTLRDHEIFAGVLAHDLRSPLNAMLTTAQVVLRRTDNERIAQPMRRIAESGARMLRLIEQLLDFTRIRVGGGITLRPTVVDLHALCRAVLAEIEAAHQDWWLRLHAAGDLQGTWDADRLAQVLTNLATNAVQHGLRDGGLLIELDGSQPTHVHVHVHNHGGIPAWCQDHIFDAFGKSTRAQRERSAGLGLGLFITQQIVLAHAGHIEVASSETDGTSFRVRLPRNAPISA